jgi:hypothetical protein
MAAIYSNGGNRWNILDFNFTKRDAQSSVYKISIAMTGSHDDSMFLFDLDRNLKTVFKVQMT